MKDGALSLKSVRHFVLDECDKMLEQLDMRADIQEIFMKTPHDKQARFLTHTFNLYATCPPSPRLAPSPLPSSPYVNSAASCRAPAQL